MCSGQTLSELLPVSWETFDGRPPPGLVVQEMAGQLWAWAVLSPAFHPPLLRAMLVASARHGHAEGPFFQVHLDLCQPTSPKRGGIGVTSYTAGWKA